MKRRLTLGVVAALAASVWAAPVASAQPQVICSANKVPPQTVVIIGGGEINIYPANGAPYALSVVGWARDVALCLVNSAAGPTLTCAKAYVNNRPTVTVDPNTLQITISYEDFLQTACAV
ncbi:MAG TPA: hypothetical protein VEV43_12885 [Actinomycetota bacterium]|nr:hypothetical protein [Actinomycetota bacterium]